MGLVEFEFRGRLVQVSFQQGGLWVGYQSSQFFGYTIQPLPFVAIHINVQPVDQLLRWGKFFALYRMESESLSAFKARLLSKIQAPPNQGTPAYMEFFDE